MGNSVLERDVFSKRSCGEYKRKTEDFVIIPLSQDRIASLPDGEWVVRAIAISENRTLLVCPASYGIQGVRYRWIEVPLGGKTEFHERVERPGDVFSKAPVEVRIAAFTKTQQTIRV